MKPYNKHLKQNARLLRSNMTDAEQKLWQKIRRKQILDLQFYRQKPLLSYIVDFYCPKAKLVIELDGGQHFETEHQVQDQQRDLELEKIGLTVLRFNNDQILNEIDKVIEVIWNHCQRGNPP